MREWKASLTDRRTVSRHLLNCVFFFFARFIPRQLLYESNYRPFLFKDVRRLTDLPETIVIHHEFEKKRSKWPASEFSTDEQSWRGGKGGNPFCPATIRGIRETKQIYEKWHPICPVCVRAETGSRRDPFWLSTTLYIYLLFTTSTSSILSALANRFDEIGSFPPVYCGEKRRKERKEKIDFRVVVIRQRCHSTFNSTYENVARIKKGSKIFSFLCV